MTGIKRLTLYGYPLSSASWRVRTAIKWKELSAKNVTIHLLDGKQHSEEYSKINPMHQVPALEIVTEYDKSYILTQSLAIIEFLEDEFPTKPYFPEDLILRAKCRAIADTICSGIQPLQNLETLSNYTEPLGLPPLGPGERKKVAQFWLSRKLENLEKLVEPTAGKYCIGDNLSVADICLVPQMFNARRFELDTDKFPILKAIDERLQELQIFKETHPTACS